MIDFNIKSSLMQGVQFCLSSGDVAPLRGLVCYDAILSPDGR